MKTFITILISLFYSFLTFGQQISLEEWNNEAITNKRLIPKYGYQIKNTKEKEADIDFIKTALANDTTNRKASNHLIQLGFDYIYKDLKTAMYRFNQAYLLDSTNSDIYWGFGGVYMTLGDFENAEKQYSIGLSINPNNTHLLTDYGTYFMTQYFELKNVSEKDAFINLDLAISNLMKSYNINPNDENTTYKLSICYWYKNDCKNALKYHDECKLLGGKPINVGYTKELMRKCN